ncbi:hypothetical protein Tco_0349694 [Tanacetum coccineum]
MRGRHRILSKTLPNLPRERLLRSSPNMLLPWRLMSSFLRGESGFEEINLCPIRGWVARWYLSTWIVETEVHGLRNRTQNLETLLEAKVDMKKVAEAKNANLDKETESLPRPDFPTSKLITNQLSRQVSTFNHSAEIDARLDALSIDFDDELTGGGRQVFDDVCSLDSKGKELRDSNMGFEAREAKLDLEAFDYETSPYLLCQLKRRPVYPEVRYLKDPWSIKEEILLEDAIAANISCAEKKKKCRVVCRTHGVGSAHHARSDDIPVLMPTVAPQGLAILLADAAT